MSTLERIWGAVALGPDLPIAAEILLDAGIIELGFDA